MSALERAGQALLTATQDLEQALARESEMSLSEAIARRESAFAAFSEACADTHVGASPRALAGRVLEIDARLQPRLRRALTAIREELDGLAARRRARDAARSATPRPRFLSRRV